MPSSNYMPSREADLVDWMDNFITVLQAHATQWQVPTKEVEDLSATFETFKPLHEEAKGPKSNKTIRTAKNTVKERLVKLTRSMVSVPAAERVGERIVR